MNDLEARRQLFADPHHLSPELRDALERRPALAHLREELRQQDERLRLAATAAPLPHGLPDRLVLAARYRKPSPLKLAVAAALVSLAVALPWHAAQQGPFELAMMQHVRDNPGELRDDRGVEEGVVRTSLAGIGVDLRETPLRIRHLGHCVVAGIEGRHFTVDGPRGVVSFVLLPAQERDAAQSVATDDTVGVFEQHGRVLIGAFAGAGMDEGMLRDLMKRMFA